LRSLLLENQRVGQHWCLCQRKRHPFCGALPNLATVTNLHVPSQVICHGAMQCSNLSLPVINVGDWCLLAAWLMYGLIDCRKPCSVHKWVLSRAPGVQCPNQVGACTTGAQASALTELCWPGTLNSFDPLCSSSGSCECNPDGFSQLLCCDGVCIGWTRRHRACLDTRGKRSISGAR